MESLEVKKYISNHKVQNIVANRDIASSLWTVLTFFSVFKIYIWTQATVIRFQNIYLDTGDGYTFSKYIFGHRRRLSLRTTQVVITSVFKISRPRSKETVTIEKHIKDFFIDHDFLNLQRHSYHVLISIRHWPDVVNNNPFFPKIRL